MARVRKRLRVRNQLGLHARPAAEFVRAANSFHSELSVVTENGDCHNAKSIMGLLTACLAPGACFVLHADGADAEQAVTRLEGLLDEFAESEGAYCDASQEPATIIADSAQSAGASISCDQAVA